ncbi:MAG: hypothetical protein JXR95_06955 [Deltaproteobacteria bacterium]|nr:hypothetical protein [Deltaproteobacteria bacterium]
MFLILFSLLAQLFPGTQSKSQVWIDLGKYNGSYDARKVATTLVPDISQGGQLHIPLMITEESDISPGVKLLYGPFIDHTAAFSRGLSLLKSGIIQSFFLSTVDGKPLPLKVSSEKRKFLTDKKPENGYPKMGVNLSPDTSLFAFPSESIPPGKSAVTNASYRDELWLLEEKSICTGTYCRRWFKAVTPPPYRIVWAPAGFIYPVNVLKSLKDANGKFLKYAGSTWYSRNSDSYSYNAVLFSGNSVPMRYFFKLKRLFYLRPLADDKNVHFSDRRGVRHYTTSKSPAWHPVRNLFRSGSRKLFFSAPVRTTTEGL